MTTTPLDSELDRIFFALAEPNRRRILEDLARNRQSVESIAASLGTSTWNALKHVRVLEESGLIESEKVGRKRICRLKPGSLVTITNWTADLRRFWKLNLANLESHLNSHD